MLKNFTTYLMTRTMEFAGFVASLLKETPVKITTVLSSPFRVNKPTQKNKEATRAKGSLHNETRTFNKPR